MRNDLHHHIRSSPVAWRDSLRYDQAIRSQHEQLGESILSKKVILSDLSHQTLTDLLDVRLDKLNEQLEVCEDLERGKRIQASITRLEQVADELAFYDDVEEV